MTHLPLFHELNAIRVELTEEAKKRERYEVCSYADNSLEVIGEVYVSIIVTLL